MKVCIAEKPSVAKELAKILGANSRKDGYMEGNGYQVTWTFGHLCGLQEPHDYTDKWKYWDIKRLPMIPSRFRIKLIDDSGVKKQFSVIESLVKDADEIINCGDAGQEGELIQRWVLAKAQCKAPIKRLWISSLTEEAIRDGFKVLRDGSEFDNLYAAGSARAIGDWLLGMNATRLYTLKFGGGKQVLSIGRVQTPTLALVVNRQKEIDNFIPTPFWELKTTYREVVFSVVSGRFTDKEKALGKLEEIKGHEFKINSVTTKNAKEHPPKLFDLTSLQVECNKKFGFSAEQTLKIIQSLYEKKLTTYPRVDTTYLSEDIYKKIPSILQKLEPYKKFISVLEGKKLRKSKKVFDDKKITDHHAIIPTNVFNYNMTPDEKRVYNMVAQRFIAVFYPDCIIANTTVLGEVNKIKFKTTGKQIIEKGWRDVIYSDTENKDENILPEFIKGESGEHEPNIAEKKTTPPKYFTEATLLRAMETAGKSVDDDELRELMKENGIGRPSTRANIIETLFRRNYIRKERKRLIATITGIKLIDTIKNEMLKSAELTGIWEKNLRLIELGQYNVNDFMQELKDMVCDVVSHVKMSNSKDISVMEDKKKENKSVDEKKLICPQCKKGTVVQGKSAWGCNNFKNGCDFRLPFEFMGTKITEPIVLQLCKNRKTINIKEFIDEHGNECDGVLILNDEGKLELLNK